MIDGVVIKELKTFPDERGYWSRREMVPEISTLLRAELPITGSVVVVEVWEEGRTPGEPVALPGDALTVKIWPARGAAAPAGAREHESEVERA